MIRTVIICSTLLAATAGVANAGEIKVSVAGKTEATVKSELFEASKAACHEVSVDEYSACVTETYSQALGQVAKIKATKLAALTL
jgi:hypothetical protein